MTILANLAAAIVLLLTVSVGLIRVMVGPTAADRMIAIQLFGTTGVAILLLLSRALDRTAFVDVALVFALLAAVSTVAFVRRYWLPAPIQRDGAGRD